MTNEELAKALTYGGDALALTGTLMVSVLMVAAAPFSMMPIVALIGAPAFLMFWGLSFAPLIVWGSLDVGLARHIGGFLLTLLGWLAELMVLMHVLGLTRGLVLDINRGNPTDWQRIALTLVATTGTLWLIWLVAMVLRRAPAWWVAPWAPLGLALRPASCCLAVFALGILGLPLTA